MAAGGLSRLARGIISYGLLGFGSLFLLLALVLLVPTEDDPSVDLGGAMVLAVIGGLPFAGGIYILRAGKGTATASQTSPSAPRLSLAEQQRTVFFDLVKKNQGQVTPMQFAMVANVSGEDARQYLQDRAKEFGADFQVNDQGTVIYIFPL